MTHTTTSVQGAGLGGLFAPRSVAVVGVSTKPTKLGSLIYKNLIEGGYAGELTPVNPRAAGEPCWDGRAFVGSVKEIPEPLDLVVVVIPAKYVLEVIADCAANGTKNVIVISAGFGEVGDEALERELVSACAAGEMNLLGPNCLGAICPGGRLNASFADGHPAPGGVAFVSQSGAFCTAMLDWAAERGIGFSHFVSLGNKAGLNECDFLEAFAADDTVELCVFYLETVTEGGRLLELIRAVSREKPVLILEPGESAAAQAASMSHTGSLAPNARIVRSAYAQAGALQVHSMRELFGLVEYLVAYPKRTHGDRIALLTNAGGVGVMSSDLIESNGLRLAELAPQTVAALQACLPTEAGLGNPIDIIGDADSGRYASALAALAADSQTDQIMVLLTPQATTEVVKTADIVAEWAAKCDKPIVASWIGGEKVAPGRQRLAERGVVEYDFPEDGLRTLGRVWQYERRKRALHAVTAPREPYPGVGAIVRGAHAAGRTLLNTDEVTALAGAIGLRVPRAGMHTDATAGLDFAREIMTPDQPVVLKLDSPDAVHKTELKGVFLNITTEAQFAEAWEALRQSIAVSNLAHAHIQVQEQIAKGQELIVGLTTDPTFGRVLVCGAGGIYTEIWADTALRVLPTDDFRRMLGETRIGQILAGVRGEEPYAVEQLVETLEKLQRLALTMPEITAIDINPLIISQTDCVCVDLKVMLG